MNEPALERFIGNQVVAVVIEFTASIADGAGLDMVAVEVVEFDISCQYVIEAIFI